MSLEEKEKTFKKWMREVIKEKPATSSTSEPLKAEEHKHFQPTDELCVDCVPGVAQNLVVRDAVLKNVHGDKEKYPLKCVGCGTPVKREQEKCPTCGGTDAEERE